MKISDLIEELTDIMNNCGNVNVVGIRDGEVFEDIEIYFDGDVNAPVYFEMYKFDEK